MPIGTNVPVSINRAMDALERNICLAAAGTYRRYKQYFSIDRIRSVGDDEVKQRLKDELENRALSEDHVIELIYLKEGGYDGSAQLTLPEWVGEFASSASAWGDDNDTLCEMELRRNLLGALRDLNPA
jgi:hypothetical protein